MICLRCGYCCIHLCVIIVNDPNTGPSKDNLKDKTTGEHCQHLIGNTCGEYACTIHNQPWYDETPCFRHTQIERSTNTPCRMGSHLVEKHRLAK